jgi:hypothetical protein
MTFVMVIVRAELNFEATLLVSVTSDNIVLARFLCTGPYLTASPFCKTAPNVSFRELGKQRQEHSEYVRIVCEPTVITSHSVE